MTQSTQAQIEAAALLNTIEQLLMQKDHKEAEFILAHALTAAAQVGEPPWYSGQHNETCVCDTCQKHRAAAQVGEPDSELVARLVDYRVRAAMDATIERCAQWIVDQWGSAYQPVANAMRQSLTAAQVEELDPGSEWGARNAFQQDCDAPVSAAAQVGEPSIDEKLEQWDEWYKTLPTTLKTKLSISDFRRLGDNFYRIFVLQKPAP